METKTNRVRAYLHNNVYVNFSTYTTDAFPNKAVTLLLFISGSSCQDRHDSEIKFGHVTRF